VVSTSYENILLWILAAIGLISVIKKLLKVLSELFDEVAIFLTKIKVIFFTIP